MKSIYQLFTYRLMPVLAALLIVMPQISTAQEELNAHPAIWMIERDKSKVYFLGSIHLLPKNVKWYGGKVKEIFGDAREVVFEVHMTPDKEAQAQQITIENGLLPAGDELRNYLEPEEYQYLSEQAVAVGIPAVNLTRFKPWFASIALSINVIKKQGWDPDSGVDKFIEGLAMQENKTISELETLQDQMATLYDHPLSIQAEMLVDTLDQIKDIQKITMEMVDTWANGDEKGMEESLIKPMQEQKEIYQQLVVERNKRWLPVIAGLLMKEQNTLVVAGVAHFIGDDGVIKMLRQQGYKVKRIE